MRKPVLTPLGLVIGKLAIKLAEENGLFLNVDESYLGGAKSNASPDEARRYVSAGLERLVWIEVK